MSEHTADHHRTEHTSEHRRTEHGSERVRSKHARTEHGTERVRAHSGDGRLGQNIVVFVLCCVPLFVAFLLFGLWNHSGDEQLLGGSVRGWLPFTLAILCYGATWLIPFALLGSKTAKRSASGLELTQR